MKCSSGDVISSIPPPSHHSRTFHTSKSKCGKVLYNSKWQIIESCLHHSAYSMDKLFMNHFVQGILPCTSLYKAGCCPWGEEHPGQSWSLGTKDKNLWDVTWIHVMSDVICLYVYIYIYIPVYPGAGDCIYLKKTCTKKTNTVFLWCCNGHQIMAKLSTTFICHINASHVVCFCTETFCVLVTLIGAMRGGRGEAVNCGPQRCSFVAQKIEWAHTGYHPIWILEYISHPEWNWNFELSWTTALASCWCSFRFWQLEDEALREKHVHRKKLLHLLRNQARVGVGYATSNPQELHIDCDSTFPGRSKYHSQFKELTTGI